MNVAFVWNVASCSLLYYCTEVSEKPAATLLKTRCWRDQRLPLVHIYWSTSRTREITEKAKIRTHCFYRLGGMNTWGLIWRLNFSIPNVDLCILFRATFSL